MHVLALVLQAAEEGSQQAKNPILPATNEIIWGSIAFIILLVGMWRFAFPAVTKMMNDRTERIRARQTTTPSVIATAPPLSPVPLPRATNAFRARWRTRTAAAACSVVSGSTTAAGTARCPVRPSHS